MIRTQPATTARFLIKKRLSSNKTTITERLFCRGRNFLETMRNARQISLFGLLYSCGAAFLPEKCKHRTLSTRLNLSIQDATSIYSQGAAQVQNLASSLPLDKLPIDTTALPLEQIRSSFFFPPQYAAAAVAVPVIGNVAQPFLKPRPKKRDKNALPPEGQLATYELLKTGGPSGIEFGDAAFIRPLLKQTQLEYRDVQLVYDASKHGYNAKAFHDRVDGKGAAVVLAKAGGKWFGGYNPRGWASLGGSRPSIAAFLFYKKLFGWQKLRVLGNGGMACGNDLFDTGIIMGAEGLVIPLNGADPKRVASRLGTYYEQGPEKRTTLLGRAGSSVPLQELKVLAGVYEKDEDIPNSGGVLDLGLY